MALVFYRGMVELSGVVVLGVVVLGLVLVVGVVLDGVVVVVVPVLLVLPTLDGLGEIVLGEPVTVDGVVPVPTPTQLGFVDVLDVIPMLPVDEVVPVEVVVLGDAVVPLVAVELPVPAGQG